jgi:LPXTG-site transpeptidase (sortase) family protein
VADSSVPRDEIHVSFLTLAGIEEDAVVVLSETFLAEPTDSWVMGQLRGRDMLTLQTCTPIPTFQKRLIVRADRV